MLERLNPILRIVCLVLAAAIVFQLFRLATRKDPLSDLRIDPISVATASLPVPARPSLASNGPVEITPTSRPPNIIASASRLTNIVAPGTGMLSGTITGAVKSVASRETSAIRRATMAKAPPSDLPPAIQAQVDRITQSEILGPVIRPLPMALLGIAGKDVFLRTPSGQVGLLREGDELGGVKLLQVGTNRVLIEHEQQKKELTVFAGFGGESLIQKQERTPK